VAHYDTTAEEILEACDGEFLVFIVVVIEHIFENLRKLNEQDSNKRTGEQRLMVLVATVKIM